MGTEAPKYQCTNCYHYKTESNFSADMRNQHRDFLACWCKECSSERARETQAKKKAQRQKVKQATRLPEFVWGNFTAMDMGDDGDIFRIDDPNKKDEALATEFPPKVVDKFVEWLSKSNEGKGEEDG